MCKFYNSEDNGFLTPVKKDRKPGRTKKVMKKGRKGPNQIYGLKKSFQRTKELVRVLPLTVLTTCSQFHLNLEKER